MATGKLLCGKTSFSQCRPDYVTRDLGMSERAKKQVVSTHDQGSAHHIFLEICIPKSLVVWPVSTAHHLSQHACKILRHIIIHTLKEHVEWLAEDPAGIMHRIQSEHVDFNFAYSTHKQSNSK